ncbi:hypothetical protein CRG98_006189 [Punica granatum]|uniref:Uncharacterized protein n=1 Tax=Punica granatum TaxID=22663 RepID=A0A2I0KY64_PUNGR|nr:hypothetical protein CRG98_006189 [Punica granatum]
MAPGQKFEEYATKWCTEAAKHIPPISEMQQIQLFHSTLQGVYYSHLLANTSSFSDFIEAEKKLDMGIKLGRMEGLVSKGEGDGSRRTTVEVPSTEGRKSKETTVNVVNPGHPGAQHYSMNLTPAPLAAPAYFPPSPQHQPQSIYYSAPPAPDVESSSTGIAGPCFTRSSRYPPARTLTRPLRISLNTANTIKARRGILLIIVGGCETRFKEGSITTSSPFNAFKPPNVQANPLPDHRSSLRPSINMINICTLGEDANVQDNPLPFVVDYTPEEPTIGFAGHMASPTPFVIDIPAREQYLDSKVPWTYEEGVGNLERQFSVMGVTRSGRIYENSVILDKGKAPAAEVGAVPGSMPFPPKKVTEEEAEAFMKIIKRRPSAPSSPTPSRSRTTSSHLKVGHIVCKYNNYIIGRVMIDNGSALNVCPVTTLKQMNVDLNRVRPSKTAVRAFDGSRREGINRPIEVEEYKNRRGLGFRPSCHVVIEARRGNHLHRLAAHYGKLNKGIPVPPLSHSFPGPPHIIGSTLDGPSSDSDDTPTAPPAVYAVTEEIPSGVHIRQAQENEELDNWTSVPRYSAVIADV